MLADFLSMYKYSAPIYRGFLHAFHTYDAKLRRQAWRRIEGRLFALPPVHMLLMWA